MSENETKPEPREYWQGFPEAPFSDSFKWTDAAGFEHLTTVRGWSLTALMHSIAKAEEAITAGEGKPINSRPQVTPAPENTIPLRDENGTLVVDANTMQPQMVPLPEGVHLFTVAGLAHDKTKSGKDVLKVWTVETPYNGGYGVSCFHPPAEIGHWKTWALMSKDNKVRYAPPKGFEKVLIRDPKQDGGYPDVVEFRPL